MTGLDELFRQFEAACASGQVHKPCEAALQWCRRNKAAILSIYRTPRIGRVLAQVEAALVDVLRGGVGHSADIGEDDWAILRIAIESVLGASSLGADEKCAVAVRAIATAFDHVFGSRFIDDFRLPKTRGVAVSPGAAVPVANPDLKGLFDHLTSHPDRTDRPPDATRSLALAPSDSTTTVRLHVLPASVSLQIKRGAQLAVGLPMVGLGDFVSLESESIWVSPKDARRTEALVNEVLTQSAQARVCLLPELSVSPKHASTIKLTGATQVLVAGSSHLIEDGRRLNQARILVGGHEFRHNKFEPFSIDGKQEEIDCNPAELQVLHCDGWSICAVICKDYLAKETCLTLAGLRVRIVLVAACSPSLDEFEANAHFAAIHAQSIVLIANTTDIDTRCSMLFYSPHRDHQHIRVTRREAGPPSLIKLTLDHRISYEISKLTSI